MKQGAFWKKYHKLKQGQTVPRSGPDGQAVGKKTCMSPTRKFIIDMT